jgi:flagellar hook-associated protein 1
MANLLSTLVSTAGALEAYSQVLDVTQNNVANASTPGYAKQTQLLYAMPFEPSSGLTGGVRAGEIQSARNQYGEQAVRRQTLLLGEARQNVDGLTSVQSVFDVSGNAGIPNALNSLFQSFSAWGQSPDSTVARQTVIERATDVAHAFQQTAHNLSQTSQDTNHQIVQTVNEVNRLVVQLAGLNTQVLAGATHDAGIDAQTNATLEQLSQYIDITALPQADGSVTVSLNGRTPLLIGNTTYALASHEIAPDPAAPYPGAPPSAQIEAYDGTDVTRSIVGGQLGALLNTANTVLPGYLGKADSAGDLNTMAEEFAKTVNGLLTNGYISNGTPPIAGVPLFTYDTGNATNVAASLNVDASVTPDQLASISAGPPAVANGVPLTLSQLADPTSNALEFDGESYNQYYGDLAARTGNLLNDATNQLQLQQAAVAQAQNLRQQMSGVSLDEEATTLVQFQRAYEANSKLLTVLDQLTETTINILST